MIDYSKLPREKQIELLKAYKLRNLQRLRKPHPLFKPLYESNKRYYLVTGGRGSLKSTEAHKYAAHICQTKGHVFNGCFNWV